MWSDMKSTKIVKFTNHKKVRFWKGDLSQPNLKSIEIAKREGP